jgi:hypothetical protein
MEHNTTEEFRREELKNCLQEGRNSNIYSIGWDLHNTAVARAHCSLVVHCP